MKMKQFTLIMAIVASMGMACAENGNSGDLYFIDSIRITYVPPITFIYDTILILVPSPFNEKYEGDIVIPASIEINGTARSVVAIGSKAFYDCTNVTSVSIPNSITRIGDFAFYNCSGLTSINLPDITYLGKYAFDGCFNLASANIPNSLKRIIRGSFGRCHSLVSLDIPSSITVIEDYAFYECIGLTSVTCRAVEPPTMTGSNVFDQYVDCPNIPLYVPAESVEAYKTAFEWKEFNPILPIDTQDLEHAIREQTQSSHKVIRDGKVLILRGDKSYTLQGQEAK